MPKYNADEQKQLSEPIEVRIDGRDFMVKKVSQDIMRKVDEIAKKWDISAPYDQLALLLGIDPEEIKDSDLRKVGAALDFITNAIRESVQKPKNS